MLMEQTIKYNDELHQYTYGDVALVSVTQIATEVCGINKEFCKAGSAERGTYIHTELANYYDPDVAFNADNFITDAPALAKFLKAEPDMRTEVIVWNLDKGYAGTIDLVRIQGNKIIEIVDWKTGTVNKKYCTVQLSLYKLALEFMGYDCSEARLRVISPKGITKITPVSWDDISALSTKLLSSEQIDVDSVESIEQRLSELEEYVSEYNELKDKLKEYLLPNFESSGTSKYDGSRYTMSYVAPTTRVSLDTARLKQELPDVFESYSKETKVSASIKLTNKGN